MSEKIEAKRDGAHRIKNSGRGVMKGDALISIGEERLKFTIDYKEGNESFTFNKKVWAKICQDGWSNGNSEGVLKVILGGKDDKTRVFIVSEEIFHDYIRLLEHEHDHK
jgi:hypothetical protein